MIKTSNHHSTVWVLIFFLAVSFATANKNDTSRSINSSLEKFFSSYNNRVFANVLHPDNVTDIINKANQKYFTDINNLLALKLDSINTQANSDSNKGDNQVCYALVRNELNYEYNSFINRMSDIIQTISTTLQSKQYSNFIDAKKFQLEFDKFVNYCKTIDCDYTNVMTLKQIIQPYDVERNKLSDVFYIISEKLRIRVDFFQLFINNSTNSILNFCLKSNLLANESLVNEFINTSSETMKKYSEKLLNVQKLDVFIFNEYKSKIENYMTEEMKLYKKKIQASAGQKVIIDSCRRDLEQQGTNSYQISNDRLQRYYEACFSYLNDSTSFLLKKTKEYLDLLESVKISKLKLTASTKEQFVIKFFNLFKKFQKMKIYDSVPVPEFMHQSYILFSNFQQVIYELSLLKDICN